MKIMVTSFKSSRERTALPSAPKPAAGHRQHTPPPETPGHSRASLGQSLVGSLLLSPGSWCAQGSVWALQTRVYFPVLGKFWQLYGGVNGDLQEGLCHARVCCTQPYPGPLHPESLPLQHSTAYPHQLRRHSKTVLSQSLWSL